MRGGNRVTQRGEENRLARDLIRFSCWKRFRLKTVRSGDFSTGRGEISRNVNVKHHHRAPRERATARKKSRFVRWTDIA